MYFCYWLEIIKKRVIIIINYVSLSQFIIKVTIEKYIMEDSTKL